MGGMIWGISSALHEATEIDPREGRYLNKNFADYLVPVNADIQSVDVILVPETDTLINPLGIKGLGEVAMSEHRRRLPMLFIMRPERASVNCRLESKNCSREIRMRNHSFPSGALSILPTNAQMRAIVS